MAQQPGEPQRRRPGVEHLAKVVRWARERDVIVVSGRVLRRADLVGPGRPRCWIRLCAATIMGSAGRAFAVQAFQSGRVPLRFRGGDPALIEQLLEVRKHAGMMVPAPSKAAATVAYQDDEHAVLQKAVYAARREVLISALQEAGFRVDDSQGPVSGATRGESCRATVDRLAALGILVAPGDFYGPAGLSTCGWH